MFLRGQCPQDLDTSVNVAIGDAAGQAEQAMRNVEQLLGEGGASMEHICKITVYLTDPPSGGDLSDDGSWLKGVFPVFTGVVWLPWRGRSGWSRST